MANRNIQTIPKADYLTLVTHKSDGFCDPYEQETGNNAHGGGGCGSTSVGHTNIIPQPGGAFADDGGHGFVVAVRSP